ncbi:myotubularin-related protein 13-like isoform X2 [Ostrea edulis]|uniref:myotubularin-related protein 13-like isoform X2 n=1 Tax=Ostrea edulis TaxID=37623 RepID=UPI002094C6AC|nr:myotubularin-related protein 13-like isoform X2 [Ostrea edulis]
MSRLADYFIVIGYDHDKDRNGSSEGRIIQRFPETDWDSCPFTQSIELFCRPIGWTLSANRQPPEFFVAVLTDIDADRHYLSVLTFSESVAISPTKSDDGDTEEDTALNIHSLMYSPKSIVLVSRLDYFETFKNCLGIIYTAYVDKLDVQLEVLVGNILGCVQVPPPGGPQVRFSIGAGDRQALQPPLSASVPSSRNATALLFQQLGIQNVLTLFCAAMTDHKILFHSQSYSRLTDACQAINILQYPLRYSYVYVPILPAPLYEVLNTPTPFIAGVHSSLAEDTADLVDVIIVDLDGGSVHIPECVNLPTLPEPMVSRAKKTLTMVMNADLLMADYAFPPPSPKKPPSLEQKDKEIRAIFIRFFAELLSGYRSCLTVIRIHPEPFITFHKANFLGHRGMVDVDFLVRVLEGMSFSTFVAERGNPYRACDIFDEVYSNIHDLLTTETADPEKVMEHVKDLAKHLHTNENPNPQPYVQKVPKPTDGAYSRIHQTPFPVLNSDHVHTILHEGIEKHSLKSKMTVRPNQVRIVPMGTPITALVDRQRMVDNNARRLEVLRNCINFLFDNKISDARIIFPAVLRALKSRVARLALTQELGYHIRSNRAVLEHQQFDLVVKLLNCCLQNDSSMDENGVAAAILPLATTFCRKLCTGIIQFAYTCVQEHAVWQNMQFWEAAFYLDVQKQIQQLYAPHYEENNVSDKRDSFPASPTHKNNELNVAKNSSNGQTVSSERRSSYRSREIGVLEIAAEQLRVWPTLGEEKREEMVSNEESTVYSQAIHYANRMVYMRVPLETQKSIKTLSPDWESTSNSNIASSLADSESMDAESGYDEMEISDVGANVIKFVTRFVDKVCNESQVTQEHIKSLHQMIPGVVAMHIETLEAVNRESKRLPPIQKPKLLKPTLLPGEEVVMDGLRVYLLPDGREEGLGGNMGGPTLLPAEGAVFLTNYRILFKGTPCDPLACEQIVIRSFPISTLTKEKLVKLQYTPHIDQLPKEGVQLRSCIFQLMKIAFDEEVSPDDVEAFRKLSTKYRSPTTVFMTFAFAGQAIPQPSTMLKPVEKNASLKNFAKKTIMKTARKAGIAKQKAPKRKYVLPTPPMSRRSMSPRSSAGSDSESDRPVSEALDDLSIIDEGEFGRSWLSDPKVIERLMERPGYQDYVRQGFGEPSDSSVKGKSTEQFRISTVNSNFSVSKSYPALLVVPANFPDDSIRRFARTHRQYRFPVVTWRHPRTKALLLRASGFHGRGLMGMLKSDTTTGTSTGEISASLHQERYFSCIVSATPNSMKSYKPSYSDSLTSLDSLMLTGVQESLLVPETPEVVRRSHPAASSMRNISNPKTSSNRDSVYSIAESNPVTGRSSLFLRAVNIFRPGGAKSSPELLTLPRRTRTRNAWPTFSRIGSIREKPRMNSSSATLDSSAMLHQNGGVNERSELLHNSVQGLKRVALYVLGEKAQMKGIKVESFPKCDFIPVEFYEVRQVKASFKKLMRACVPSAPLTPETGFHKLVEESEWLLQVQNIMQLAGATVDLLDVQGSSVIICLEDGWDITTQVVSVAQLLLDPYYRTIEGFKSLVEKEWLSFGHRFTHRSNQTAANQASGFAPLFLQFLDVIHQIHNQFPLSFEYNQFFLRFIGYHYVSNRFRTFMMDNEYERVEAGWLMDDRRSSKINHEQSELDAGFAQRHQSHQGTSIWDYIEKHHRKSTLFLNFQYSTRDQDVVLRPYSNISNLRIWDFFLNEDLAHGPAYEIETTNKEIQISEEERTDSSGQPLMRKIVNGCYDNVILQQPNVFRQMLQEIHKLETDLGHFQQKWKAVWDKLDLPTGKRETMQRNLSFNTQIVKSHGRSIHKRSTLEILVKGKMLGEAAKMFSQPHRFEKHTYTTPAYCDYCGQVLWGLLKTGMHCTDCGYNCHEKCTSNVPKNCTKLKIVPDTGNNSSSVSRSSDTSTLKSEEFPVESGPTFATYTPASANTENSCLHKGYLFKRGALLKGWKQRWFVLDSTKHQLRYYDSEEDTNCKGYIELFDVQSVQIIRNVQGAPKKADENAFFELKTNRRVYNFLAADAKTAQIWIDRIHGFI